MGRLGFLIVGTLIIGMMGPVRATGADSGSGPARRSARLAAELRRIVDERNFADLTDRGLPPGSIAPTSLRQPPNVDVAVIEQGRDGRPIAAANVLLSPHHPSGVIVPLDADMATDQVRWWRWNDTEWDQNGGRGSVDAVPGRENAPLQFMSPYPASILKLMVGFGVFLLLDRGAVRRTEPYEYRPTGGPGSLCSGARTAPVEQLLDEMLTVSSNEATCALITLLHRHGEVDRINALFRRIGLPTLQLVDTDPGTGGNWFPAVTMNALDTAKLLLIVDGPPGVLWRAPDGTPVTRSLLSRASRRSFHALLADQGLNQVLSTTNWCGRHHPPAGIPQWTPTRWIDPSDGTVTVGHRAYGQDVRPCQERAEVVFAHKTGLIDTAGGDAGIVSSLPGKPFRRYIVVVHSNLGERYIDPRRPADPPGAYPVAYTEKFAHLGRAIDQLLTTHHN